MNSEQVTNNKAPISHFFLLAAVSMTLTVCKNEANVPNQPGMYPVTVVSNGAAGATGNGQYAAAGNTVSINAGSKNEYTFSGWTADPAVTWLNNSGASAAASFIMPASDVTVTANWTFRSQGEPEIPVVDNYGGLPVSAVVKSGRRPIPVSGISGKGYDDLLFYARSNTGTDPRTPEEIFLSLSGGRVIADNNTLMAAWVSGTQYGSAGKITVSGMPFTQAWQVTVTRKPANNWDFQLGLPGLSNSAFSHGDTMLLVITMRTISTAMEDGDGKIQCIVEQPVSPNNKALMGTAFTPAGEGWFTIYLPFSAVDGYNRLYVRLGLGVQTVQFGGYQIINYESRYTLDQLPGSGTTAYSEGWKVFDRDFQWRRDAWTRIEHIRKGDVNVIVKDASGNPVEGAQVKADMYEHEFKWGTAVNANIISGSNMYKAAVPLLFNTATLEGYHQWRYWENNPAPARNFYNALKAPGINNVRGHALVWDRTSSLPQNVSDWFLSDVTNGNTANKTAIDNAIRTHISAITGEYRDQVYVWDVVNEVKDNADMQNYYGRGMLKDWFAWARAGAGTDCLLFINETGITGVGSSLDKFKTILNWMRGNNVDFDGIGIQGHFGNTMVNPESFYNMLEQLNEYNKFIEITEFDMGPAICESDREFESSFTRDIMIAAFSQVNTIGFTMWGFTGGSHWHNNAPVFNADWTLKESGKQYIDLVYNKWRTNESGRTGEAGAYRFRGFYGDYDITVSAGGKTKTVEARFYKGGDNTVTVTLELGIRNEE